jgi:hypothetical protein
MICESVLSEQDVWQYCFESYLRQGIKLKLPNAKDYTKTYQWRFIKSITKKFKEWDFDPDTCQRFIDIAITHAKELGVINKGLSVLHQQNMMNICYKKLKNEADSNVHMIKRLESTLDFLDSLDVSNLRVYLMKRPTKQALTTLTSLFFAKKISLEFMALNKAAISVLNVLEATHPHERDMLPSDATLYLCRKRVFELYKDSDAVVRTLEG